MVSYCSVSLFAFRLVLTCHNAKCSRIFEMLPVIGYPQRYKQCVNNCVVYGFLMQRYESMEKKTTYLNILWLICFLKIVHQGIEWNIQCFRVFVFHLYSITAAITERYWRSVLWVCASWNWMHRYTSCCQTLFLTAAPHEITFITCNFNFMWK